MIGTPGLSEVALDVTRHRGTEDPRTSKLWKEDESGVYHGVCCDAPLFRSEDKFISECGWPAFNVDSFQNMVEIEDLREMPR